MNHRHAKKQPKAGAKKKITGKMSSVTPKQITLQTAKGVVWKIDNTDNIRVIKGTVTVEFSKKDGRPVPQLRRIGRIGRKRPPHRFRIDVGKRTEETGRVIGLTSEQVTLDNTTPDAGTWIISKTDGVFTVVNGTLALGATNVTIDFLTPPAQHQLNL